MHNGHSYSSTQFNLPAEMAKHVQAAAKKIPTFALHGDGREKEPHVTVKYGIESDHAADIRKVVSEHPAFKIKLGKTSHFPDSGDGDVIKVEVHSPELHALHHKIAKATPTVTTHPTYLPHATLAYVSKGLGKPFSGSNELEGLEAMVDKIIFSSKNGSRETIRYSERKGRWEGIRENEQFSCRFWSGDRRRA
jgi:2'-5' RNA ligase